MKTSALLLPLALIFAATVSCTAEKTDRAAQDEAQKKQPVEVPTKDGMARAYFASGCFWCVEAIYERVKGVKEAHSGYSGGHTEDPTYESSNTGTTGHAEAVEVIYDSKAVSFATLVDVYFNSHDITEVNGQGPDKGTQYRSIVFYQNEEQKKVIEAKVAELNKKVAPREVAAEILPFEKFWLAEAYHQDYEANNPDDNYIRNVSMPRLQKCMEKMPGLLRK